MTVARLININKPESSILSFHLKHVHQTATLLVSFRIILLLLFIFPFTVYSEDSSFAALSGLEEKVEKYELSNGIRVLIYNRPVAPVFSGYVTVKVGGVDEPVGSTGISHMLEHMAFKGSRRIGTKDFSKEKVLLEELENIIIQSNAGNSLTSEQQIRVNEINTELEQIWEGSLTIDKIYDSLGGVDANATTSADTTNYFISLPVNSFHIWAELEAERLKDPVYRQFYKERNVVIEERRMRTDDDPGGQLYERMLQHAFAVHPYKNPVIGYRQDINSLTASATLAFQKKYYVPANIVITLVGDLDASKVLPVLEGSFGDIKASEPAPEPNKIEPEQISERRFSFQFDSRPQMVIAYHKPNYPDKDDVPLTVFFEYLLSGNNSPLIKELVIEKKTAFSIDYSEGPGGRFPNLYFFHATPKEPHSNQELLSQIDQIIERHLSQPLSSERIDMIRRQLLVSSLSGLKSNLGLAGQLAYSETIYGDWRHLIRWYEILKDVTPLEVQRVARKYISKENRTIGFLESAERK